MGLRAEEPFVPSVQSLYWLASSVLPPGDPEDRRAVVVLAVPGGPDGTVAVVSRSSADGFGVEHAADPALGLTSSGHFSRRQAVQGRLWTPANATPAGTLDDDTFAEVVGRFRG